MALAMVILLVFLFFMVIFSFFISLVSFIVTAVPYYIMGQKAGFRHAWIAFLPMGRNYIALTIPHREYNLGIFKTNKRSIIFWIWLGFSILTNILSYILSFVITYFTDTYYTTLDLITDPALLSEDPAYFILQLLSGILSFTVFTVISIISWRMNYDLLKTYDMENHAMWASIVNIFFPIVMIVFSFIIMNRVPEYGYGRYYSDNDYSDDYYYDNYQSY